MSGSRWSNLLKHRTLTRVTPEGAKGPSYGGVVGGCVWVSVQVDGECCGVGKSELCRRKWTQYRSCHRICGGFVGEVSKWSRKGSDANERRVLKGRLVHADGV